MGNTISLETVIIGISAVLYVVVAISFAMKHNWCWAMVWASYSIANFGLTLAAMNSK